MAPWDWQPFFPPNSDFFSNDVNLGFLGFIVGKF
jgi:hypothetical protein